MKNNVKRRVKLIAILVYAAVMVALYVYIYFIPDIEGYLTETSVVTYGKVTAVDEARCIVVRDETLYTADHGGEVSCYVSEASKICKGVKILDIYSGGTKYSMECESTSFVSFYSDGLEEMFTPDTIDEMDPDDYAEIQSVPEALSSTTVLEGEPVYKLISSNTWYMLIMVPEEKIDMYSYGSTVTVNLTEDFSVKSKINKILGSGAYRAVVVSTKHFYEDFGKLRTLDVSVITSETEGLLVPSSAITLQEEVQGVYVLGTDGEYYFKAVTLLVDGDSETLIKSDENVRLYDEVLRDASEYRE